MKVIQRGTVFDATNALPHERCCAFTSLVRLADGTLLCSFKSGPSKLGYQDRLLLMRTLDEGAHWERLYDGFDTTFEGTPGSLTGGYLFEAEPGRLLISLQWVDRTDPTLPLSNPQTSGVLPMKYLLAESHDSGRSWSQPREVSLAPHPGANPAGAVIRLQDGRLLLPYESWREWDEVEGDQTANVKFSSDEGNSWSDPITMATDPAGHFYFWDNHLTKHPSTHEILVAFWTHDAKQGVDAPMSLSWGEPDGSRWSDPKSTSIQGQVVDPLFLDEDRLLLTYVHRHDPPSIRAILSNDRGESWQHQEELVIHDCQGQSQHGINQSRSDAEFWDDMARWTFGHPKSIRLPNNQIFVVYYAPAFSESSESPESSSPDGKSFEPYATPTSIYWARLG